MTEGWVLAIFISLLGFLVLVGMICNASISRDEERRHRGGNLRGRWSSHFQRAPIWKARIAELEGRLDADGRAHARTLAADLTWTLADKI
jgi:hypothetical protein